MRPRRQHSAAALVCLLFAVLARGAQQPPNKEPALEKRSSVIDTGGFTIEAPAMKKIGPNLYAATEKRVPLTPGGSVFPYVFGYMMVTFPFREARPFAFTFTDLKMPAGSRGSRGPADWQAPAPLEVTGVAEQMAQFGTGVSIAYKQGVVEQGSYLLGLKFSSGPVSNLEEATQGFELGLQEVNFRIPKFVGGIQIGKESDNLFVMKGRLTQGRLQLVEGFRVVKAAGGHWGIRPIAGELIDFYQPRLPTKK